jgi:hypothetical protein
MFIQGCWSLFMILLTLARGVLVLGVVSQPEIGWQGERFPWELVWDVWELWLELTSAFIDDDICTQCEINPVGLLSAWAGAMRQLCFTLQTQAVLISKSIWWCTGWNIYGLRVGRSPFWKPVPVCHCVIPKASIVYRLCFIVGLKLMLGKFLRQEGPQPFSEFQTCLFSKNSIFWNVTPCSSCKNRCFGGM